MAGKEDIVPLVAVKPVKSAFCRTTSCIGEPRVSHFLTNIYDPWLQLFILKETALNYLLSEDVENLSNLLASTFPADDDSSDASIYLPLPDDHWINSPYDKEADFKSLLHLAAEKNPSEQSIYFIRLLMSAGARYKSCQRPFF